MPELPEVETTIKGLKPIINSTIINIKIHTYKLRFYIPQNISLIKKTKIKNIKRKGKYIIIVLKNKFSIIVHLGMSGRLRLIKKSKYKYTKHDHFIIKTNKNHTLIFNDSRKFGFVDYVKSCKILQTKYFLKLGIDALSSSLNEKYLFSRINESIIPIKQILLNQNIIAGIGNIYASEILFNAKISPLKKGKDLKIDDCKKIVISIRKILKKAIKSGGSTLRDYISADGTVGNFQNNFKVYNKQGATINGKTIKKIVQYGRSTFYCPELQKNK